MKELDSFTVKQLNHFIESDHAQCGDVAALARIALSAKQTEPVAYWNDACDLDDGAFSYANDAGCTRPLYTTPQLNSPEIPEGWKLVPIEPTQNMVDAHIIGMQLAGFSRAYRAMLAAAPEKPL
ncbi:hypothetical protein [Yersinia vastinensis]|uniref:hypothetical protein n=1 Tax=Yersinia vastinensis TaxID=2890318 RepID=UPI00119CDCD5|nr:hypothetical protein [Yersinia vastinensis]